MSTIIERVTDPSSPHGRRRRRVVAAAALIALLAGGLAAALTVRHLDHQYGPLEEGSFGGVYSHRDFVPVHHGFDYRLAPRSGATGKLFSSLDNLGAHSVSVTSIEPGHIATSVQWSPYRFVPGGLVSGVNTRWRSFPAVVPAHGTIRLLITLRRPTDCRLYPYSGGTSSGNTYNGYHTVHWHSLLHDHTTTMQLFDAPDDLGVRVC